MTVVKAKHKMKKLVVIHYKIHTHKNFTLRKSYSSIRG